MSKYMILVHTEGEAAGRHWYECGTFEGASAEAAIRGFVQSSNYEGGVFLAIPERSAKTIRVKVETVQKVSVDAGDDGGN